MNSVELYDFSPVSGPGVLQRACQPDACIPQVRWPVLNKSAIPENKSGKNQPNVP